jgi:hypothetical protein
VIGLNRYEMIYPVDWSGFKGEMYFPKEVERHDNPAIQYKLNHLFRRDDSTTSLMTNNTDNVLQRQMLDTFGIYLYVATMT